MLVGGKWFWCCKDNIIFPLRHHRTARVFPTHRAFSVRPPHSARWAAPNCALLPYLFTSSAPSSAFSCLSPPPLATKRRTSGNFGGKFPIFHPTPAFCRAPRTAHPPCAIRCIFPPHLRSATGGKLTSSIYSCTTSSDAGVPFPFRCRKVPSLLATMRPSPRLLASFAFKILFQLVQSLLTCPSSPVASSTITLSPRSSTRLSSPLIGDTFSRHDTKAHDSHNNSMLSLPFFHSNSTFVV